MNKLMFWVSVGIAATIFIFVLKTGINAWGGAPTGLKSFIQQV